MNYTQKISNIWQAYYQAKNGQTTTIRSGYGLYGIYPFDMSKPFDYSRSESDAEHVIGTEFLARPLAEYFPEIIPYCEQSDYLDMLRLHEMGENVLGDIPDNGNRDETAKDEAEFAYLSMYLKFYPEAYRSKMLIIFKEMQTKATERGRTLYCIDKTEAILQNLIYERQGRGGDLNKRLTFITEPTTRDKWEYEMTGSSKPADMWSFAFFKKCEDYEHIKVFRDIIVLAAREIRGELFNWLDKL